GGDGTFLEAASLVHDTGLPIVGINSGRLGFLADISQSEIGFALEQILDGKYLIEERSLVEIIEPEGKFGNCNYALNEVTFHKMDSSSMITIHAYLNNVYLNTYWADGLIISTPTGSTAYSLSVGGPIVSPDSSIFILSPIASHNLTVRPFVIPDHNELMFEIEGRGEHFLTSLDSRSSVMTVNTRIRLRKADFKLRVIKLREHDFYSTLRNKLMWGADKRN
ncbi:MAG: NAD kinase, partial [Bacteroidota bacterium]|nr:NAD kinase [Bacteroidota bacterium]